MKYITTAIFLVITLGCFNSCKKNNTENTAGNLVTAGAWELESVSGDMPTKNYPPGNGNVFEFTDSTYKKYTNGTLSKSGHYSITPDATVVETVGLLIPADQFTHRIIFDNDTSAAKTFIDVLNKKLRFVAGFFPVDGGSLSVYGKKTN